LMNNTARTLIAAAVIGLCGAAPAGPLPDEAVIPVIQMENVPLTDAIRQMARKAPLNVVLDPRLAQAPYTTMTVSIRWEKVTAREALLALLENHDLVLVESPRSGHRH